jgi:hypothetical protein
MLTQEALQCLTISSPDIEKTGAIHDLRAPGNADNHALFDGSKFIGGPEQSGDPGVDEHPRLGHPFGGINVGAW